MDAINAQNLVPNPSFENYSDCPFYVSQISFANGWNPPSEGTPDYFNSCADPSTFMSVPSNEFGSQNASDGNAYAGFYGAYNSNNPAPPVSNNYREYIQCRLTEPLVAGRTYRLNFDLSLSDYSHFGIAEIGAYFSTTPVAVQHDGVLSQFTPQIINPEGEVILEKNGWMNIQECFTPDSDYQYMVIGCFADNNQITIQQTSSPYSLYYAYYYIDALSLVAVTEPTLGSDISQCSDDKVILHGHTGSDLYSWSTGNNTPTLEVENDGTYWLWQRYEGCWFQDSVTVRFLERPSFDLGLNREISFCETPQLDLSVPWDSTWTYNWSTGSDSSSIVINLSGLYELTITNNNGCSYTDEITVFNACSDEMYIPNTFTPNDDGINDTFSVHPDRWNTYELIIYSRWGQEIHRSYDPNDEWTGNASNNYYCPDGIYTYQASWTVDHNRHEQFGHVNLIR